MTLLSAYPQVRLYSLAFLALIGLILGGLAAGLANLYTDIDLYFFQFGRLKAAAGLLAFDGFFILVWSVTLIVLTFRIHDHENGFMKWLVGPLGFTIQVFILWVLVLGGAAALSDAQGGLDCSLTRGELATFCNVANATLAFGWILWIFLLALLGYLIFCAVKTPRAQGGLSSTSKSDTNKSLDSGKLEKNEIPLSETNNNQTSQATAPAPAPATSGANPQAPQEENQPHQMPQPTHYQA